MTTNARIFLILAIVMILSAGRIWAVAEHDHDKGHDAPTGQLHLNDGRKWATDQALRQGMRGIQDLIESHVREPAPHEGVQMLLAQQIKEQVSYIFQNCRLDKEADAMLHLVLVDILEGVSILSGERGGHDRREGPQIIAQALEQYGRFFDHPGWAGLRHDH